MSFFTDKRKKKRFIWLVAAVAVLAIIIVACAIYVGDYYQADSDAIAVFEVPNDILEQTLGDNAIVYMPEDVKAGLILLGSYSATDLSNASIEVLSIYGSEDRVMNREKYDEGKSNLPDNFTEVVIDGGCHAYFGMYGAQEGDGTPSITNEEQIIITTQNIFEIICD